MFTVLCEDGRTQKFTVYVYKLHGAVWLRCVHFLNVMPHMKKI